MDELNFIRAYLIFTLAKSTELLLRFPRLFSLRKETACLDSDDIFLQSASPFIRGNDSLMAMSSPIEEIENTSRTRK